MRTPRLGATLLLLALAACGRVGPPVAPQHREPQPATELTAVAGDGLIELAWTNPTRRVDNSMIRDLAVVHVFRTEDAGAGEPRAAMRSRGQIAGYDEVASIRMAAPAPAIVEGQRVRVSDRHGLTYGRRYTYAVLVEDVEGRLSPPSARLSVTYLAPPAPPENLQATAGEGEVRLRWTAPDRLVDDRPVQGDIAYEVVRTTGPEGAARTLTTAPVREATFTDRDVVNDQAYTYAVRAVRTEVGGRARGSLSSPVTATPQDLTPPSSPRDLVAVGAAGDVRLSWTPSPESDVARYVVYRADPRGAFARIGSTPVPGTTYVDRGLSPGTYRYAVTAQDRSARGNESALSGAANAVVP